MFTIVKVILLYEYYKYYSVFVDYFVNSKIASPPPVGIFAVKLTVSNIESPGVDNLKRVDLRYLNIYFHPCRGDCFGGGFRSPLFSHPIG